MGFVTRFFYFLWSDFFPLCVEKGQSVQNGLFSFSSKTNLPKDFKNGNPTKEAQIENQVRKCNLVTYF
jgi:hypothetical protein